MDQQPDRRRESSLAWHDSILTNREEAGLLLAERLLSYRADPDGLILALPGAEWRSDTRSAQSSTSLSAVTTLKTRGVRRLIAAIPAGPAETIELIREQVDSIFVFIVPQSFFAVANQYQDFAQVEDSQVIHYLKEQRLPSSAILEH